MNEKTVFNGQVNVGGTVGAALKYVKNYKNDLSKYFRKLTAWSVQILIRARDCNFESLCTLLCPPHHYATHTVVEVSSIRITTQEWKWLCQFQLLLLFFNLKFKGFESVLSSSLYRDSTGCCGDFYSQSGKIKDYILSFRSLFDNIHQGKHVL